VQNPAMLTASYGSRDGERQRIDVAVPTVIELHNGGARDAGTTWTAARRPGMIAGRKAQNVRSWRRRYQ